MKVLFDFCLFERHNLLNHYAFYNLFIKEGNSLYNIKLRFLKWEKLLYVKLHEGSRE